MEYEIRNMDELTHWGIKGMKWGVRRYQNKDGSLTPAGKKRMTRLEDAKSAAEYYKKQRNEHDEYYYQKLDEYGKLGEKKWREAVKKGYKGDLAKWFETEGRKDLEMVDRQAYLDTLVYKHRNLDRKYEASLAYAETLVFKNSDRTVDRVTSEGIWKEGKNAVDRYLDEINRNVPTFKRDPNSTPDYSDYDDAYHSAMKSDEHLEDELAHHGIRGMRWGIRRFQKRDGSLTPAGKRRRAQMEEESDNDSADTQPVKKTASNMSDDELARAITRARMEDEYRRLRPEPKQPEKNAFAKQMLNDVVKPAAINSGKKLVQEAMDSLVKKITGDKVDPDSVDALKKTFEKLDYKQKIDKLRNPDKYLSEEDKNKRQQRDFEAETREAQREGYQSVTDRAKAKREAADAQAKADAEAKKVRDEFVSRAASDADASSRRQSSWEKTTSNIRDEFDFDFSSVSNTPVTSLAKTTVSSGRSTVDNYSSYSYSELLDRSGNVVLSWGDD